MTPEQIAMLPLWYAMFLLALTCHEAAHAWAAHRGGDDTAYLGGQVSLNPLPHMQREVFGTVVIPLLTFIGAGWMMGWASAPYDPSWEDRHPRRAALMAAAGPAANFLLAAVAMGGLKVGAVAGLWFPHLAMFDQLVVAVEGAPGWVEPVGRLLSIMFSLNLLLGVFNLLPLPPLDGAAVLAGLFEPARRLREQVRGNPMTGLVGLLVAFFLFGRVFYPWIYLPAVQWLLG